MKCRLYVHFQMWNDHDKSNLHRLFSSNLVASDSISGVHRSIDQLHDYFQRYTRAASVRRSVMKTTLHRLRQGSVEAWLLILFTALSYCRSRCLAFYSQLTADLIISTIRGRLLQYTVDINAYLGARHLFHNSIFSTYCHRNHAQLRHKAGL